MNQYTLYQSLNAIDDNILIQSETGHLKGRSLPLAKWSSFAACFCLMLAGVLAIPNLLQSTRFRKQSFPKSPLETIVETNVIDSDIGNTTHTNDENRLDEERVIPPDAVNQLLTWEEAQAFEPWGAYLPTRIPAGYAEESFRWYQDENTCFLSGLWTQYGSYDEISWRISPYREAMADRITSASDTRNYDLSLYPIPRADSVPKELYQIVDHPIFRIEELTMEVVDRRAYTLNDAGDSNGVRMSFCVLYDDVVVDVTTKGVDPEWLYEQLILLQDINNPS